MSEINIFASPLNELNPIVKKAVVIIHENTKNGGSKYCCSCNDYCGCEGKTAGCDCELDGIDD